MAEVAVKVRVELQSNGMVTHSVYPTGCACNWMVVETPNTTIIVDDKTYVSRLGVAEESLVDQWVANYPADYEKLDITQANDFIDTHAPRAERITDGSAVLGVLTKIRESTALNLTDSKIIDPNDSEPGVNLSPDGKVSLANVLSK